jgi:hypothetical protein
MAEQLLAARNPLIGTTNILLIGLPDGWRLLEGYGAPEIDLWTEYRERRWMSRGHAVYRLVEPHPGRPGLVRCEVELAVEATPLEGTAAGGRTAMAAVGVPVACKVGGHEGKCLYGTVRRGLFPRRTVPALVLEWTCPQTRRRIRIALNAVPRRAAATAEVADLERVVAALVAAVKCH